MNRKKKVATTLSLAIAVLLAGGVAFALWSSNATGSARAGASTAQNLTANAVAGSTDLFPGFADGDLEFTVTNPNPYPVRLTAMTPGAVTSLAPVACPSTNLTVDPATGLNLVIPANSTSGTLSVDDGVTLATAAPDGCQGVGFDVAVTFTGTQI